MPVIIVWMTLLTTMLVVVGLGADKKKWGPVLLLIWTLITIACIFSTFYLYHLYIFTE